MLVIFRAVILLAFVSQVQAQTLQSAELALAKGSYLLAADQAKTLVDRSDQHSGKAAVLLLRSLRLAQNHDGLEEFYQYCLAACNNETEKGQCALERAISIEVNLNDGRQALQAYGTIASEYTNFPDVAADALLRQGDLANKSNLYHQAKLAYTRILNQYQQSQQVLSAYSGLASVEASLMNPAAIQVILDTVKKQYPDNPVVLRVLLIDADFANRTSGDSARAIKRYTELVEAAPTSIGASTARLRLADILYPHRDFSDGISDYHAILREFPQLSINSRAWSWCQIGIYHYQLDQIDQASKAFAEVASILADAPDHPRLKLAKQYMVAIDTPDSIEGLLCLYDKAVLWRQAGYRDYAWEKFTEFVKRAEAPGSVFERYCNNPSVSVGERAQMRYKKAFALFEAVDHNRSVVALEEAALELSKSPNLPGNYTYLENVTNQQCQFFEAYHHIHHGHFCHSIPIFRRILDNPNRVAELVPKCYKELIHCYLKEKDPLGAALTAEEFLILYPYRVESQQYTATRNQVLNDNPEIVTSFKTQRDAMIARIGSKPQTFETALNIDAHEIKQLAHIEAGEGK